MENSDILLYSFGKSAVVKGRSVVDFSLTRSFSWNLRSLRYARFRAKAGCVENLQVIGVWAVVVDEMSKLVEPHTFQCEDGQVGPQVSLGRQRPRWTLMSICFQRWLAKSSQHIHDLGLLTTA